MALQFGVELELLLGGRKKAFSTWKALADDVSKRLHKAGVRNHVRYGKAAAPETYREWAIVPEVTIPNQPAEHLWGIELVSPVYAAAWRWADEVAAVFAAVQGAFVVVPSAHCSTHVHVSTAAAPLTALQAVLLAEAALYYEPALDALMPPGRRGSAAYWCRSNRESHGLGGANPGAGSLDWALSVVRAAYDAAAYDAAAAAYSVAEAVNLLPADCAYGRAHGKKSAFVHGKVFKWNFAGLDAGPRGGHGHGHGHGRGRGLGLGTVEFRQPPGSLGADDACAWVTLTLALVAGVTAGDGSLSPPAGAPGGASLAELWQVLQAGAGVLGWDGLGAVDGLFRGSSSGSDQ